MRVRLSYTVEKEKVLAEAGSLVGLTTPLLQKAINLFGDVQKELQKELGEDPEPVNTSLCLEMIEELRGHLLNLDTRLSEIIDIVNGFDEIRRGNGVPDPADLEEDGNS
jgi:hypothetical protein